MMMMIKMAAVSTITLLLLCCLIASTDSHASCNQYAATGGNFTVNLNHKLDNAEQLRWIHNKELVLDRRPNNKYVKGTKEDVSENGSLKLINLTKSKAGTYTPEVFDRNGHAIKNLTSTQLCILDPVPKPKVEFKCSPPSVTSTTLTCKVQAEDPKFKWFQNNKELEKETGLVLKLKAEALEKDSFRCEVYNSVSSETSDPVDKPCYKYKPFLPDEILGINIWVFIGGGGGIVLMLIIIVIVCCVQGRRKKRLQLKDEGELRLAWTNEQQQQHQHPADQQHQQHQQHHHHHHHHPHHHQQQPAGHTGPRQHRSKQHRDQQRPKAPDHGHPLPSPRRAAQQAPKPVDDDEQPPPLPQPRKKAPKTPRV